MDVDVSGTSPLTRMTFEQQNIERWEMSDIETIIPRSGHLGAVPLYQRYGRRE